MQIVVNPQIFTDFDNPRIGVLVARGIDNTHASPAIAERLNEVTQSIREQYQSETLSKVPAIAAWRDAHRQFGSKPKDYPSSIEALYKRILKGQDIGSINSLVDIYNYISLKYMLPLAEKTSTV